MSKELFTAWAPPQSDWSQWAKPAPFIGREIATATQRYSGPAIDPSAIKPSEDLAVILELPGAEGVALAVGMAQHGWRPVPMINTTAGNMPAISMEAILGELRSGAPIVQAAQIPESAPPVFILDSGRGAPGYSQMPRTYDNRWMVFPQDFPSGNNMLGHGIRRVLIMTREVAVRDDLIHVLRRWQEAGIQLLREFPGDGQPPHELTVNKPSRFKSGWYRLLVAMGLKKNSAGGFGGWIPEPSQSGHG
ncbi:MAG: hypothetical protein KF696_14485 [Planctomycetes bacterium]|nr:hypothetical protein [Planctomycetota bacterium]MCW8136798.1 hypothetical protein [Planctomycetota bacterium]